ALPGGIEKSPALRTVKPSVPLAEGAASPRVESRGAAQGERPGPTGVPLPLVLQKSVLPELDVKLLFTVGSAHDPVGKEGLAALTASMISEGGSRDMTIEQIEQALYPIAGSFSPRTDKEMTTFTGRIHRDEWRRFLEIVLPQLLTPGFRTEDFT